MEFACNLSVSTVNTQVNRLWLLDSGVSCHIATHKDLFSTLHPLKIPPTVCLPDGNTCCPKFCGFVYIFPKITLHNVYLVPEFKVNLMSVSCLIHSSHLTLVFLPEKCLLQDPSTNQVVGEAHQHGNLYQFLSPLVSLHLSSVSPTIWHQRLGHASKAVLIHLNIKPVLNSNPCDSCHLAKQHRLPFSKNSLTPLHLLHLDL